MEKVAVRNLRLCTKDCLCLYVCPTGASDTENSIIDVNKCIGCGECANACPSKAISMVPKTYPPQQVKDQGVINALFELIASKSEQEKKAMGIAQNSDDPKVRQLALAIAKSNRMMSEDLIRESGYMLPQSNLAHEFLQALLAKEEPDLPKEKIKKLLEMIPNNDKKEKWQCAACGYIHEGEMSEDFTCPRCLQPASIFEKIEG